MLKRIACAAAMLAVTGAVCGAAVKLCSIDTYEPDPDAYARAIMNYVQGDDKTHVTVNLHRFTPETTYTLLRITAGSDVSLDWDNDTPDDPSDDWWLIENTLDEGWFILETEGDLTTNKKGHLLFHETYPDDIGPRDLLVFAAPVLQQTAFANNSFMVQGDLRAWCVECWDDDD